MRKISVLAIAALMLTIAAVAYAQERTNKYSVSGSVTPGTKSSTKKPVPVAVNFNYTVDEQSVPPLRPSPVQKYSIRFAGLRQNSNSFPGCTAGQINNAQGITKCPKGSLIGTGSIDAVAGGEDNRSDRSIACPLKLQVYNSRKNKAAIYVAGGSNAPSGFTTTCPTTTNAALDANFVRRGNTIALEFNVPLVPFRQQLGTIEVAVVRVQSKIPKKTVRRNGKTIGFFESVGGCKDGERIISVTFLNEDNKTASAQDKSNCK